MKVPRVWWIGLAIAAGVAALLPLAGRVLRTDRRGETRCALDGRRLDSRFIVRLQFADETPVELCSLRCAELWLQASGRRPDSIRVVDESTGGVIDASDAYYVRSRVVSHPPTRDRRHVFRREVDARTHAAEFAGRVLDGEERPFADYPRR